MWQLFKSSTKSESNNDKTQPVTKVNNTLADSLKSFLKIRSDERSEMKSKKYPI